MIHVGTVMKVLGERKTFIGNHPDFLGFVLQVFGGELEEGTVLEVRITRPGRVPAAAGAGGLEKNLAGNGVPDAGVIENGRVELRASDMDFFRGVQRLVREIVKE